MHSAARQEMAALLDVIPGDGLTVLDVGSLDVNGSYRADVEGRGWSYTGLDIRPGRNVDIVADDPFRYQLADDLFDVVISGSTMEHVTAIWDWVPELARVLKLGGALAIVTHWQFPIHRYPVDCWRILPDGLEYLFDRSRLTAYEITAHANGDLSALAWKEGQDESTSDR